MKVCFVILLEGIGDTCEDAQLERFEIDQIIAADGMHVLLNPWFNSENQPVPEIVAKLKTSRPGIDYIPEIVSTSL